MNHQKTSQWPAMGEVQLSYQIFCFIPLSIIVFCDHYFISTLFVWLLLLLPLLQAIKQKNFLEVINIPCNEISGKLTRQEICWGVTSSIFWILCLETSDHHSTRSFAGWLLPIVTPFRQGKVIHQHYCQVNGNQQTNFVTDGRWKCWKFVRLKQIWY